ncbi:UNVERIFIED_CONTAM: putative AC transposase [Sesamum calycinum]|uniref:AC transposase n=1 Tax=Sesamum calycinum TaxID=2727403 RepID=A0AAW2NI64_9LAMI
MSKLKRFKSQNPQFSKLSNPEILIPHLGSQSRSPPSGPHLTHSPLDSRLCSQSSPHHQAAERVKVPQLFVDRCESSPSLIVAHLEISPQLSFLSLTVGYLESLPKLNSPSLSSKLEKLAVDCPESNTEIEMSKDIPDRVEIEETSEDNSKRKRTSEAWNHFKRVKVEDIQFAECNYCKARLKAPAGYGTTHLHKHYEKVCKKRPRKIDIHQSFLKTNKKLVVSKSWEHISSIKKRRDLCFNIISRNTLKDDIFYYNTKYYNLLRKIKCRIAITTDMWTSSNNKGFMAVTGHFIDDNWTLQNCILRFLYVPAPHTSEVLVDTLVEALIDCNIDHKVSTITVDNCTTNDAMINHLLQKLPTKDMPLDGKKLARDILAIPVSTVASESAFSSSGKLINPHRNRLHHTTVEALMCSRRWLWNEANGNNNAAILDDATDKTIFVCDLNFAIIALQKSSAIALKCRSHKPTGSVISENISIVQNIFRSLIGDAQLEASDSASYHSLSSSNKTMC